MAGGYSAPGVYRREIDLSDILVSQGVSNGGIVIRSKKGPIRRPVLVTDNKNFVETFGAPYYDSGLDNTNSATSAIGGSLVPELGYGSYGALEFLTQSSTLYVVRAYDDNDKYATVEVNNMTAPIGSASYCTSAQGISAIDRAIMPDVFDTRTRISTYEQYYLDQKIGGQLLIGFVGPGEEGNNYAVTIETLTPTSDWLYSYDPYPTTDEAVLNTVNVVDGTSAIMSQVPAIWCTTSGGSATKVAEYFKIASEVVKISVYAKPENRSWDDLYANDIDKNENRIREEPIEVFYGSMKPLRDADGNELFIERAINGNSKFIYVKVNNVNNGGKFSLESCWNFGSPRFKLPYGTDEAGFFFYNTSASKLGGGKVSITSGLLSANSDGVFWQYFNNREEIPVQILINTSFLHKDKLEVGKVCNLRKDCIATNPVGTVKQTDYQVIMSEEKYGYPSPSFMSLYAGYSQIYDYYNDKFVYLPNSIFAASVFARVDNISYPWYAPAGVARATLAVLDQNKIFSADQIGKMYDKNINAIKLVQGAGFVIWGQKTAQLKKSALDRINVRRSLIYIQTNIERALNGFVFENNTQQTRLRIYSLVDEFLAGILASDGLYAYDVVCDTSNNPPSVIDANQLNVDIYVQPVKTAEFIQFTTVVTRTGVAFGDVRLKYA